MIITFTTLITYTSRVCFINLGNEFYIMLNTRIQILIKVYFFMRRYFGTLGITWICEFQTWESLSSLLYSIEDAFSYIDKEINNLNINNYVKCRETRLASAVYHISQRILI